jgi:hypothetical protein
MRASKLVGRTILPFVLKMMPRWRGGIPVMESLKATPPEHMVTPVDPKALSQLKFSDCLPRELGTKELESRLTDCAAVLEILSQRWTKLNAVEP